MSSTLNGDFLQFIIPYFIRSPCESEVPVPMTHECVHGKVALESAHEWLKMHKGILLFQDMTI